MTETIEDNKDQFTSLIGWIRTGTVIGMFGCCVYALISTLFIDNPTFDLGDVFWLWLVCFGLFIFSLAVRYNRNLEQKRES